ncbi:tyrosine-type recombinase/integrase [Roseovarius indicus]|uniref:Site-specific recombinase XerD n=1 Tax=Roseovarius indicus TaxID=540747 RepID=A0A0T5PDR6_9RHOB|nr:tyrosine-type recombinase/integrase [Roseovarius indicus]KRS19217.1 Site-specific recombinase XerD-like protein [Roseovarius indicus]QEW25815.1 Site-specific recombinase XerD [Roseovarius indicus]SFD88810.1 Site-specific recombinase XerD [Roseovarius indicus]
MDYNFDRDAERLETVVKLAHAPSETREALIAEYRKRSEAAFAKETLRNYRQITQNFRDWCSEHGHNPDPPVDPRAVAEYVDYLGGKVKCTTIETRLWAISEMHRATFQPTPCRHRLVELALKGVKRKYGAWVRQAPPLCKAEVYKAIQKLGNSRQHIRDKAVLWVATDSWCRSSEIVAFKVRDLIRQDDGSSLLFVAKSKTDQFGQGAYAFLSEQGTAAVLEWIELAGLKSEDPLLTKSQANARIAPMDPATISRIIKRCTGRKDVSAHSTRVGGVHDAFRIGCDLSSIMVAGRWTSPEMPARYGRRILASNSAAAKVSREFARKSLTCNAGSSDG